MGWLEDMERCGISPKLGLGKGAEGEWEREISLNTGLYSGQARRSGMRVGRLGWTAEKS